jgi:hypothetical protein
MGLLLPLRTLNCCSRFPLPSTTAAVQNLRKGAIVMLCGRSQLNEKLQGDFSILQQISALRRENRLLKVGLIFCLVLSALPYLTGFQPETITAKTVVTEKVEFVRDRKTVMSISPHPKSDGLVILGRDELPVIGITGDKDGGLIGTYNKDGKLVASMMAISEGGGVGICNNDGKLVASMGATPVGGTFGVHNKDGKSVVEIGPTPVGGAVEVHNKDGTLVAVMGVSPLGGVVTVRNNDSKPVARMGAAPEGGGVGIYNNDGKPVVAIGVLGKDGQIYVFNNDGKLVWSAP